MLIHATTDATGVPFAVLAGQDFTTHWLKITSDDDAEHYGEPMGAVIEVERCHGAAALLTYSPDDLDRFLIQTVTVDDPPAGEELEDLGLSVDADGVITAAPTFRAAPPPQPSVDELATAVQTLQQEVAALRSGGEG